MKSPLPPGVTLTNGQKVCVSERGYFAHFPDGTVHFTACMFASDAQLAEREGYSVPLGRTPPTKTQPMNFVRQLQLAGDATPKDGSTMRQSQKALAALLPDSTITFGSMSDDEIFTAIEGEASIRVIVDCGLLDPSLKNYVGRTYNGGHSMVLDGIKRDPTNPTDPTLDVTDHMYRPAKLIQVRQVRWSKLKKAVKRRANGDVVVTVAYQGAAQIAALNATVSTLQTELASERDARAAAEQAAGSSSQQIAEANQARDAAVADLQSIAQTAGKYVPGVAEPQP